MRAVLDTHVWLWWLSGQGRLTGRMKRVIDKASADNPLILSDISLREVALLVERGRISLDRSLRDWLEIATAPPLIMVASITPPVAAAISNLPANFTRDPADCTIVATAQVYGAVLLTADRAIVRAKVVKTVS